MVSVATGSLCYMEHVRKQSLPPGVGSVSVTEYAECITDLRSTNRQAVLYRVPSAAQMLLIGSPFLRQGPALTPIQ